VKDISFRKCNNLVDIIPVAAFDEHKRPFYAYSAEIEMSQRYLGVAAVHLSLICH
jgi:hypothetical protein